MATATTASAGPPAETDRPGSRWDFHRYLAGSATSTFGTIFTGVAASALAVQTFHVTGFQAGLLTAASTMPALLVMPVAGAFADRVARPRRVLIGTELAAGLAVGAFMVGVATHLAGYGWLLALTLVLGVLTAIAGTLFFIHLNSLRSGALAESRARLQATSYVVGLGASASAAPAISAFGPVTALATDAVSYLVSAVSLRSIRTPDRNPALDPSRAPAPVHREAVEGIRILIRSRLRPVVMYVVIGQSAFAGVVALKALFFLRTLRMPLYLYGIPGLCGTAFGVLGSIVASRSVRAGRDAGRLTAGYWAGAATSLLLLPASAGPLPVAVASVSASLTAFTLCGAAANVALVALISESTPEHAMGRVTSSVMVVGTLATTVGALAAGGLAELLGIRDALWCCCLTGVAALPLLRSLLR
ncbi:MAG: MFS transporter [Mycobacteriales bacterium]